jgi:hypothetical protein
VIPFDEPKVSLPELLTTMAEVHPEMNYTDARPVLIDGKHGCAMKIVGDGHEGQMVLLPADGAIVVFTVGHAVGAAASVVEQMWTILSSVRVTV